MLRRQNRADEARRLLDQAKADEPTNASVRLALSALHAAGGRLDEALKELETLPRQNWTPRVALVAGQLDVQTGRYAQAVTTRVFPVPVTLTLALAGAVAYGRTPAALADVAVYVEGDAIIPAISQQAKLQATAVFTRLINSSNGMSGGIVANRTETSSAIVSGGVIVALDVETFVHFPLLS